MTNIWVILGLSALIIIFGWFLSRWIARLIVSFLNRTPLIRYLVKRLKLADAASINRPLQKVIRTILFILLVWAAWILLNSHPAITEFIVSAWEAVVRFVNLPVVIFILDLVLIGIGTYLLFKTFGWVKRGSRILAIQIRSAENKHLKGFKIQRVQVFTASQLTRFLLLVDQYALYLVYLLLILIYLTSVFSVFPQTRGVVMNILGIIFEAIEEGWLAFASYVPNLLNLIVIIIFTFYGLKLIRFVFREIEKGTLTFSGFYPEWAVPTYQLVRVLVIALALVIAFPYLPGSSSPAFQGISVFIGLLLSLGASSFVANVISGIVLTYTRAFQIGDRVQIADTVGDVVEKGLLVTRIRTIKNVEITIPNGLVLGSHVINYSSVSKGQKLILHTTVTLGYDISWRLIHETLIKAAQATGDILAEPRPFVLQTSLDDSYVSYELNAYTDQPNKMATIYSDLHQNIQDFCNQAGIEILSPHFSALRDGNNSTIPPEHLPKDYQTPPFQIRMNREKK